MSNETPEELFHVDLENDYYIDALMWPDEQGFVNLRAKDGHIRRGTGFKGRDQADESMIRLLQQWEEDHAKNSTE